MTFDMVASFGVSGFFSFFTLAGTVNLSPVLPLLMPFEWLRSLGAYPFPSLAFTFLQRMTKRRLATAFVRS